MTVEEILEFLDTKVKEADARNIDGDEFYLQVEGRWHERFPGNPKKVVSLKDDRGIWVLTLDEVRDLRDFLTDNLNTAADLAEEIGAKPEPTTSKADGATAAKRLARSVKGHPAVRRRHGTEYPWEGA